MLGLGEAVREERMTHIPYGGHKQVINRKDERIWLLVAWRKWWRKQFLPYWFIEILNEAHEHVKSA